MWHASHGPYDHPAYPSGGGYVPPPPSYRYNGPNGGEMYPPYPHQSFHRYHHHHQPHPSAPPPHRGPATAVGAPSSTAPSTSGSGTTSSANTGLPMRPSGPPSGPPPGPRYDYHPSHYYFSHHGIPSHPPYNHNYNHHHHHNNPMGPQPYHPNHHTVPPPLPPPPLPHGYYQSSPSKASPNLHDPNLSNSPSSPTVAHSATSNTASASTAAAFLSLPAGGGCTCKRSKCLKLYCQCFSSSTTCGPKCKCQSCHNTPQHGLHIEKARRNILDRNPTAFDTTTNNSSNPAPSATASTQQQQPHHTLSSSSSSVSSSPTKQGCKCRKSFCLKKYCECFTQSQKCGFHCRCVNCRNQPQSMVPQATTPYVQAQCIQEGTPAPPAPAPAPAESTRSSGTAVPVTQDRMAIMAAVAMTELLGGVKRKTPSPQPTPSSQFTAKPTMTSSNSSMEPPSLKRRRPNTISLPSVPQEQLSYQLPHHQFQQQEQEDERAIVSSSSSSSCSSSSVEPEPKSTTTPTTHATTSTTNKSSALPKSLSFRKICSKCGKTRSYHGELGFGHRCVFQDCGKCGAGIQIHQKHGMPMGVMCRLTEQQGAVPGAAKEYQHKLEQLALRAELQQRLQQEQQQQQQQEQQQETVAAVVTDETLTSASPTKLIPEMTAAV